MKISTVAVAGAILALSSAQAFAQNLDTNRLRAIGQGRALYLQHCAGCHGPALKGNPEMTFGTDGRTVSPPDLTALAARHGGFDAVHVAVLVEGRPWGKCREGMPCWQQAFAGHGRGQTYAFLQIWKLSKYLQFAQAQGTTVAAVEP